MALTYDCLVRPVELRDRDQLSNLIFDEKNTSHRHLDWRSPLDWIGFPPYFVIEQKGQIRSVLACPADPPGVAWVQVFGSTDMTQLKDHWNILWEHVRDHYKGGKGTQVCVITMRDWFQSILEHSDFFSRQKILMLTWTGKETTKENIPQGFTMRKMELADIPRIAIVDALSFEKKWHNSEQTLQRAFKLAALVTVMEYGSEILGYQLSTTSITGGHLARLAVLPDWQGRGIGKFLVMNLIENFTSRGINSISVNTQNNNNASLYLYKKLGFIETGESYPVYEYVVS